MGPVAAFRFSSADAEHSHERLFPYRFTGNRGHAAPYASFPSSNLAVPAVAAASQARNASTSASGSLIPTVTASPYPALAPGRAQVVQPGPGLVKRMTPPDSETSTRSKSAIDRRIARREVHLREKTLRRTLPGLRTGRGDPRGEHRGAVPGRPPDAGEGESRGCAAFGAAGPWRNSCWRRSTGTPAPQAGHWSPPSTAPSRRRAGSTSDPGNSSTRVPMPDAPVISPARPASGTTRALTLYAYGWPEGSVLAVDLDVPTVPEALVGATHRARDVRLVREGP